MFLLENQCQIDVECIASCWLNTRHMSVISYTRRVFSDHVQV